MSENRYRLARERAGLSLCQAARITGLTLVHLSAMEMSSTVIESDPVDLMAEKYGVSVEWLTGACERYDYASARQIKGFSNIEYTSDAAAIAEFVASMPKRRTTDFTVEDLETNFVIRESRTDREERERREAAEIGVPPPGWSEDDMDGPEPF